LELLEATIVVHNILIEIVEEERKEWIDDDDFSDFDDAERGPYEPGDILNQLVPDGAPKDERRTRLLYYFEENCYFLFPPKCCVLPITVAVILLSLPLCSYYMFHVLAKVNFLSTDYEKKNLVWSRG
jgi:hypothetical protein